VPRLKNSVQNPLSAAKYVTVTLVGLLLGIGMLVLYLFELPRLPFEVQPQVFFVLLIPFALSAAAFLFGAMNSFADLFLEDQQGAQKRTLSMKGPVVLFGLILIGGLKLIPSESATFDLTVRAVRSDGTPVMPIGDLTIDYQGPRQTAQFDEHGEARFYGLDHAKCAEGVRFAANIRGYSVKPELVRVKGNSISLTLESKAAVLHTWVRRGKGDPVSGAIVTVDSLPGAATTKPNGEFSFEVPGGDDRVHTVHISYGGHVITFHDVILPGPAFFVFEP
jgi:hypothetical protein